MLILWLLYVLQTFNWNNNEEGEYITHTSLHHVHHYSITTGWILAAFFYGYIVTQIPGGWLAERIGGKWVFGVGVVMTSVFTLLTPLAATSNVGFLIAVRVLEGFFEVNEVLHQGQWSTETTLPPVHVQQGWVQIS